MLDIKIETTRNGKKCKNLEDALKKDLEEAVIDGAKQIVQDKLKNIAHEINRENGSISIDIKGDSMSITYENYSPELERKITEALNQ